MAFPEKTGPTTPGDQKRTLGEGVFRLCDGCGAQLEASMMRECFEVCPRCGHHHRLRKEGWLRLLCDEGELLAWDAKLRATDPLSFDDGTPYARRIQASETKTGEAEAIETGEARLDGIPIGFGCFVFDFMGGSMGSVVGEKIARLFERAAARPMPVVLLQASGGARMQEGILSLMQMAKCVAALDRLKASGMPFVSCLAHPTTGGVAASFAFLGDVNVGESRALIGFAGPRVIENTIRQQLPEGFQRAEFLLEHGMLDRVCSRLEMKATVASVLRHLCPPRWMAAHEASGRASTGHAAGSQSPRAEASEDEGRTPHR